MKFGSASKEWKINFQGFQQSQILIVGFEEKSQHKLWH